MSILGCKSIDGVLGVIKGSSNQINIANFVHQMADVSQFSVPQIEYPLGGSMIKGSHVYFLLIVAMILLLWHQIVLLWHQFTMVPSQQYLYQTIVLPRKLATGSIYDHLFCYCPLVGILFEVLRIGGKSCNIYLIWTKNIQVC